MNICTGYARNGSPCSYRVEDTSSIDTVVAAGTAAAIVAAGIGFVSWLDGQSKNIMML